MIHRVTFKDISDEIEEAKRKAKEADAEWDKEYEEYLKEKEALRREKANDTGSSRPLWLNRLQFPREVEKRERDTPWQDLISSSYINALEALNGKTFEFKNGLNVIVGENGCGKSSLLKAIRGIFCANGSIHSTLRKPYWSLDLEGARYLRFCQMTADYHRCVFNLIHDSELDRRGPEGVGSFLQLYNGMSASSGEKGVIALHRLMEEFRDGNTPTDPDHPEVTPNSLIMQTEVIDVLKEGLTKYSERSAAEIRDLLDYYEKNQMDDGLYPVLMDEPDVGFDIHKLTVLFSILNDLASHPEKSAIQPIVVLHNAAIILKLLENKNVNFIELTPGYLEEVRAFKESK